MPWFVVDDNADSHPKMIAAGNAALGLWLKAGAYASRHLTDGIVPGVVARMYSNGSKTQVAKLVAAGLWHEHGHTCRHPKCKQPAAGDYAIHDYLVYNPSRAEVERKRERAAEKKRKQRAVQASEQPLPDPDETQHGDDGDQDDPPRPGRRDMSGQQPIAADWQPSDDDVRAAQLARADAGRPQLTPQQLDAVTRKFVRRMRDEGRTAAAWGGRWQQWAETERTEQPTVGNVVHLPGAMTKSAQQRAGLDRLRGLNGGHSA